MPRQFDVDAIVAGLDAEIEAAEARAEEVRKKLEVERDEVIRLRRARRDLTGEPINPAPAKYGGRGMPRTGRGPKNDIYAPMPNITEPIIEYMKEVGRGVTNQDLVDAGLARRRERAADYLNRMEKFGMVKKGKLRKNPNPSASKPFQEFELP